MLEFFPIQETAGKENHSETLKKDVVSWVHGIMVYEASRNKRSKALGCRKVIVSQIRASYYGAETFMFLQKKIESEILRPRSIPKHSVHLVNILEKKVTVNSFVLSDWSRLDEGVGHGHNFFVSIKKAKLSK